MTNQLDQTFLKVVVETTKEKGSYKAGKEITNKILQNLNDKPDFILLFSTGHYEFEGGFEELLKGVWENLSEDTKLIGGTVNGFITNEGCFAQGVAALAVKYDKMNITVSYGKNTKRNPKKAAKQFVKMIHKKRTNTYKNKLLITHIATLEASKSSGGGENQIVKSKIGAIVLLGLLKIMQKTKQKGFGREDEILAEISKQLPDFNIIHGSSGSTVNLSQSYQFFNKNVLTESVVGLTLETDLNFFLNYANAAEKTDVEFKITKISKDKHIIKEINNKPALPEFLRLMNWTKEDFEKTKWIETTSKHPIGYIKNNKIILRVILMIMGNYLGSLFRIEKNDAFILKMSTEKMIDSVDELLKPENPDFALFVSCTARQGLLGLKIFQLQEKLKTYFNYKPFLLIYFPGEGMKKTGEELECLNETIACAIFEKNQ